MKYNYMQELWRVVSPALRVGGLAVHDGALRFILLDEGGTVAREAAVDLPQGVVRGGRIMDEARCTAACIALRKEVGGGGTVPVIVSISAEPVYTQVFSLPPASGETLEEAARVHLKVLSPLHEERGYMDWQFIEGYEEETSHGRMALGAVVEAQVIDAYERVLRRAGFVPAAIEYAGLSIARVVAHGELNAEEPYLVVSVMADGMTLCIIKKGNPYFTRFVGWPALKENTEEGFYAVLGSEIKRLLNFYSGKWGGAIAKALVINELEREEIASWIKKEYALEVFSLAGYEHKGSAWFVAVGAALRGLLPRAEDRYISIARVGTEDDVARSRIMRVVRVWRQVAFGVMALVVVAYAATDYAVIRMARALEGATARAPESKNAREAQEFLEEARVFNMLVDKAVAARHAARRSSEPLATLFAAARESGTILREVGIETTTGNATLTGTARNEQGVIAFKNKLATDPRIARVDVPLSGIATLPGSTMVSFTATVLLR